MDSESDKESQSDSDASENQDMDDVHQGGDTEQAKIHKQISNITEESVEEEEQRANQR